jgi:hypothetical protein
MGFSINIPLYKRDEERRLVWGRATREELDKSNEIMDYASSKPNFEAWSNDFATRTGGKSYGNCRLQHDSHTAIGKIVEPLSFNDDDKAIDICVKVVDDKAWELVKSSVLTGFSVGGSYGSRWKDEDGIVHYTAVPSEISLCDNPCVSSATIECIKTDGAKEVSNVDKEKETQVEAVEKAVETETVEKTAVEIEPKDEPKPEVEKTSVEIDEKQKEEVKDEIEDDDKDDDCDCDKECKKRDFTAEERKKLAEEGKAMPDGSFPIENKEDLKNAIRLAGQAKDKKAAIDFICRRARALGAEDMIPEGWCKADKAVEAEEMTKADCQKEDIFEAVCKAMDKADDSIKEKCGKLFHKMVEKGLYCSCDKCAKAIAGEKAEKAAADNDLHKAVETEAEPMQKFAPADELAKAMGVIDELKKGFDALKSDNEALKKQVEKLENEPVAGGAIMATGTMALDKTIGGNVGKPPVANSEADVLKKMIAETDSAVLKEAYSKQLAQLEMKKVFG